MKKLSWSFSIAIIALLVWSLLIFSIDWIKSKPPYKTSEYAIVDGYGPRPGANYLCQGKSGYWYCSQEESRKQFLATTPFRYLLYFALPFLIIPWSDQLEFNRQFIMYFFLSPYIFIPALYIILFYSKFLFLQKNTK